MVYSFADFKIEYAAKHGQFQAFCKAYESGGVPDFELCITDADIKYENSVSEHPFAPDYLETVAFYRKLAEKLPTLDAFVFHSALFDVDGVGIALTAVSGTGKTTHMSLWQKLVGDRLTIVNGDKPIIRFFESDPNTPYGYGTPWSGKERLNTNMRTPLRHICLIERAQQNSCERIKPEEALDFIFNQVYMPKDPTSLIATMSLIDKLLKNCSLWRIRCNKELDAAKTAYNAIFEK